MRLRYQPQWGFMLEKTSRIIALGFGSGLVPFMPGTVATLFAWVVFYFLSLFMSSWLWGPLIISGYLVGVFVCQSVGRELGVADHSAIVWDEIMAFWMILAWNSFGDFAVSQFFLFVLFRFFDVFKPFPIGYCDRHCKGGFGVMFDDFLAALYTMCAINFLYA